MTSLTTSHVGSKTKFLIVCPCWLRRAKQPYQIEIKPRNYTGRGWDTSKQGCGVEDFKRLQLRLRLRLENIDSDSSSDSTPTPPSRNNSILQIAICCSHFLDFPFDCTHTGNTAKQQPFAQTADAAGSRS